jgi:uncharacterized protein YjbI with pentapeptide repeats
MTHADLSRADLSEADLRFPNLCATKFINANLRGAIMSHTESDYSGPSTSPVFTGATMPDGSIHD